MPTANLSTPPAAPIDWLAVHEQTRSRVIVTERTWHRARQQAAIELGADPASLVVSQYTGLPAALEAK